MSLRQLFTSMYVAIYVVSHFAFCNIKSALQFLCSCSILEMCEAFQTGLAQGRTQVLIDKEGASLCCQVIIRC